MKWATWTVLTVFLLASYGLDSDKENPRFRLGMLALDAVIALCLTWIATH
jgi:hypothetical protein